jgi:hypothetical protein
VSALHHQEPARKSAEGRRRERPPLSAVRIGLLSGLVGMFCCVGPTVLALLGLVSAATAFAWATDLYDGYAWLFRLAGLAVLGALVWWSLRRRSMCSLDGVRTARRRIAAALGIAVATYGVLYAVTTWLGTFA